jgi:hypothetical protein
MAYEMLTGRLPFTGADVLQILAAHMSQPPPPPTDVVPGFPAEASTALLAGLAKEPAARLLPWELVDRLAAVPQQAWPAVPQAAPVRRTVAPSEPTVRGVAPPATSAPSPVEVPATRRPTRRIGRTAVLAVAGAAVAVTAVVLATSGGDSDPAAAELHATSVAVSVSPAGGDGRCPEAVYTFTADVQTNGAAGEVTLRWTRPDGRRTDPVHVPVSAGQESATAELSFQVTGERPLSGRATAHVLAPDRVNARSAPITYSCS